MKKSEILDTLAKDYARSHTVYASMEKQAAEFLRQNKMDAYQQMARKAAHRAGLNHGIRRAAVTLGIDENDFMEAVARHLNK